MSYIHKHKDAKQSCATAEEKKITGEERFGSGLTDKKNGDKGEK